MTNLIECALGEWDEKERIGPDFNPRIAEYLATCGLLPNDEISWCSAFITWCATRVGIPPPLAPAVARSWLTVGQSVTNPRVGDIIVLRRGKKWQGHVGLFVRSTPNWVFLLGGNQGDRVGIAPFDVRNILGSRRI